MADDIAQTAQDVAAAVAGPNTPNAVKVSTSTKLSELTMIGVLLNLSIVGLLLAGAIAFRPWPANVAKDQVHYLGWGLFLTLGGVFMVALGLASPYLGRMTASAGLAKIDVEGR